MKLPPPTDEERAKAREALAALRAVIAGQTTAGEQTTAHIDFARPRRGQWWTTWSGLPGLTRVRCSKDGESYTHACLPGWGYTRAEIRAEMIPDLEALADRGERPAGTTR